MARKIKGNGSVQVPKEPKAREDWLKGQVARILKGAERVGNRLVLVMGNDRFSANDMNAESEVDSRLREQFGIPTAVRLSSAP